MLRLARAYGGLLELMALAAALMLLLTVALVVLDVGFRNLTPRGIAWADEVAEYALYGMTLLTAPWLLHQGQHVRVDILVAGLPDRLGKPLELAADLAGLAISLVIAWYGLQVVLDSRRLGAITIKMLVFPEWWLLAPLPVAFLLIAVEFTVRSAAVLRGGAHRDARALG